MNEWQAFAHAAGAFDPAHEFRLRGTFSFVHETAVIGEHTILFPGVYIGPYVHVGVKCVIGPNTSIGQPGFGYAEQIDGGWKYKEHHAGVVIADDVHIGSNTSIDQGRHRATVIGPGTRIDDNVFVAHNVLVGQNCLLIAGTMIGGSCEIHDGAVLGTGCTLRDHVTVGERALIGCGSVVVGDVEPNAVMAGNPAKFLRGRRVDDLK